MNQFARSPDVAAAECRIARGTCGLTKDEAEARPSHTVNWARPLLLLALCPALVSSCSSGATKATEPVKARFHLRHIDGEFYSCIDEYKKEGLNPPHSEGWDCRDLRGADLKGKRFDGVDLSGTLLDGAHLENASFRGAKLYEATFVGAQLDAADFSDAELGIHANFDGAGLSGSRFERVGLNYATFYRSELKGAKFSTCRIVGSDFIQANLVGAEFTDCPLINDVDFYRANLEQVTFRNSDLSDVRFYDTVARGARFLGLKSSQGENRFYSPRVVAALGDAEFDSASVKALGLDMALLRRAGGKIVE